jgi:hypothetical protein
MFALQRIPCPVQMIEAELHADTRHDFKTGEQRSGLRLGH